MTNEGERQIEEETLPKELIRAKELMNQGQIKEALQIVLELEKSDNFSGRNSFSIKLLKADILDNSGEFLEAIKYTDDLFQQFQKEQDLLSSYDTLVIQAHSLIMLGKLSKGE
ncbi:MAG: hypothetical protein KGD61_11630, partial [Candidatus Lokiarchaeota archaeon]|nr:hypothetical protein [Candidatus Lokiarchaeota archaeon]